MPRTLTLLGLEFAIALAAAVPAHAAAEKEIGRFQIVETRSIGSNPDKAPMIFLLDTATGRSWVMHGVWEPVTFYGVRQGIQAPLEAPPE